MTEAYPPNWAPQRSFADGRIGLAVEAGIATLAISIPQKMNALDVEATAGMIEALEVAEAEARVLILTGLGGRAFISGADIGGFDGPKQHGTSFLDRQRRLAETPLPTIAAIRGYCIGGGLMTALNCDIRLAATDAQFGVPAAKLGIAYGHEGLARLVEAAGAARARRLLYAGDRVDAQTALAWGLVEHVLPPERLWDEAMDLARRIASNAPLSIHATKRTVAQIVGDPDARDPAEIERLSRLCRDSDDFREGRAAFHEKRQPNFTGR
ncbi:enoyl-CoA hydratase-related protein [Albimonas pacifica]|uniref:Enoyl-CoA hydratase/carnithine racemase n=1 Tax=Albimonas pacifica TaxID=1114924 RepID=A0A1I3BRF1_9RHOB|nr:enoyl-CoA hydratase-related protein [Albimonas pacifica]SFH64813.1 Enoyl-CoA hydratase/carnithine racemase [Albimonas pacifica]